jgi:hypothetical protein
MALTIEWLHRIELWNKALWDLCYRSFEIKTLRLKF